MIKSNKNLRIIGLIQARMGSKRLKNKALLKINGKTIIQIIFERLKAVKGIDDIILSTSASKENDVLTSHAKDIGLKYYRGSEDDLILRHLGAVNALGADAFLKVTADCPLVDVKIADEMLKIYKKNYGKIDFMTNCLPPTFPDGLDLDITPTLTLENLGREIKNPLHREYYAAYIMENPAKFKVHNFKSNSDFSSLRWTLDYQEDLGFIKEIFDNFKNQKTFFMEDILKFMDKNPKVIEVNKSKVDKTIINNIRSKSYHEENKK
ncbi:MAG: glycosyltransferase family protein [Patescibacteria group bacterium]